MLVVAGCGVDSSSVGGSSVGGPSVGGPSVAPGPAPQLSGQPPLPVTRVVVSGVELRAELATTPDQQAAGLRGRSVPLGAAMAFPYPGGKRVRFTMSGVELPLLAVFAYAGRAVSVEQLVPCTDTVAACPTYGPPSLVDLVVEAAPDSLPTAAAGDAVTLG